MLDRLKAAEYLERHAASPKVSPELKARALQSAKNMRALEAADPTPPGTFPSAPTKATSSSTKG